MSSPQRTTVVLVHDSNAYAARSDRQMAAVDRQLIADNGERIRWQAGHRVSEYVSIQVRTINPIETISLESIRR